MNREEIIAWVEARIAKHQRSIAHSLKVAANYERLGNREGRREAIAHAKQLGIKIVRLNRQIGR